MSRTESQVAVDATQIVIAHALCARASHLHIMLHERILSELQRILITGASDAARRQQSIRKWRHLQHEKRLVNEGFGRRKGLSALQPVAAQSGRFSHWMTCQNEINSRGHQPPAPQQLRQPVRSVHAVDVPHDSVSAARHGQQQDATCDAIRRQMLHPSSISAHNLA